MDGCVPLLDQMLTRMKVAKYPRLAIFGCRKSFEVALLPVLRQLRWIPGVLIHSSMERAAHAAQQLELQDNHVRSLSDWNLIRDDFDAAIVALPPDVQWKMATELLAIGKHVYLETLGPTASPYEWRKMSQTATRSGLTLKVAAPRRHLPSFGWTKALIASGNLGQIKQVTLREGIVTKQDVLAGAAYPTDPEAGGGLWSVGADSLDQIFGWFGDLELTKYEDDSEGGTESERRLQCRLSSEGHASIEFSRTRRLPNSVLVVGTGGFVEVHLFNGEILGGSPEAIAFRAGEVSASGLKPKFARESLAADLDAFRTALTGKRKSENPASDFVKVAELIDRCYASRKLLAYAWSDGSRHRSDKCAESLSALEGKRVLVTGATGFVGGRLVERLVREHGAQVRCIVRDEHRAARLARFPVQLFHADLCNSAEIARALQGTDFVFHCAHDTQSRTQNTDGLRNLINACSAHPVRRLVHVSTFAVYEPFPDGPLSEETGDGERSNAYVDIKLDLEKIAFDAVRDRGVATTIVQPAIVYGPFCWAWTNIPAEKLLFGEVILPEAGEGLCNAVYIDDLVNAMLLAAISPGAIGERFIISGPDPVTWATFYSVIADALNARRPSFWPSERIREASRRTDGRLPKGKLNLTEAVNALIGRSSIRRVLEAGLGGLPPRLRRLIIKKYGQGSTRWAARHIPDQRELAFYSSKAFAGCEKARAILNYRPEVSFECGMALTAQYLRWAYLEAPRSSSRDDGGQVTRGAIFNRKEGNLA